MQRFNNKNTVFSVLLALVAVVILNRIIPPSVDPVIKLEIAKNREPIHNVHQARNIELHKVVMVDKLDLAHKNRFIHPKLGNIGYADSFFVDIKEEFRVKTTGQYLFKIGSDDGFSAKINGELLCEHVGDRPFSVQNCPAKLPAGNHLFELTYFQGYGNAGLTVEYLKAGTKPHFFGENSRHITFD